MFVAALLAVTATAADPARPAADPAAYGNRWLVMLSAKVERGYVPDGLTTASTLPDVVLRRLDSSAFKNLMPCYELVVAGSFATVDEARALGQRLASAGIDHALKNAGAHIGDRPELKAACAAMRSPPKHTATYALAGQLGAPVPVPEAIADRALVGAPDLTARTEESWAAPITAQTVGPWTVGANVHAGSYARGTETCTVTGFLAGVEGTAHFGWREAGLSHPPPCGETRPVATLSCAADVVTGPDVPLATGVWTDAWTDASDPGVWPEVAQATRAAVDATEERDPITATWKRRTARLDGQDISVYTLRIISGDGEWVCGGGDYMASYVGMVGPSGRMGGWFETTGAEVQGIFRIGDQHAPSVHTRDIITQSDRVHEPGGQLTEQARGYCDCPC